MELYKIILATVPNAENVIDSVDGFTYFEFDYEHYRRGTSRGTARVYVDSNKQVSVSVRCPLMDTREIELEEEDIRERIQKGLS